MGDSKKRKKRTKKKRKKERKEGRKREAGKKGKKEITNYIDAFVLFICMVFKTYFTKDCNKSIKTVRFKQKMQNIKWVKI